MKVLHTSDWHLGKYLEQYSRLEEQESFIDELVEIVNERKVDLIIIAGDIYDNSNPSAKAERLFYKAIKRLSNYGERVVLIIAGNHDNPDRLVSSRPLAYEHGIILLGTPKSTVEAGELGKHKIISAGEGYVELEIRGEKAVILTLPYPSEQRLNEVFSDSKDEEGLQKSYSERVGRFFSELSSKFRRDTINICVSHIFVMGGETTESERPIQIGGGLTVDADKLPQNAHYIALGHLHKCQRVKGHNNKAFYSGSPIQYSKSEIGHKKYVFIIDMSSDCESNIEKVELNIKKPIEIWQCNGIQEAIDKCIQSQNRNVWAYLEIRTSTIINQSEIKELKRIKPDILTITPIIDELDVDEKEIDNYKDKSIHELFKEFYLNERRIEPSEELMAIFSEIISEEGDEDETETA